MLKQSENTGIIFFLNEIVPFCSALFLFVAGFSIVLSIKNSKNFNFHLFRRGGVLVLCSSILFIIENGFQFPDFIFCSGILNTIGIFLIISSFVLFFSIKQVIMIIVTLLSVIIFIILDMYKIYFVPFNYGYEPIFPTIIFGLIGLSFGLFWLRLKDSINKRLLYNMFITLIGFLIIVILSIKFGFFKFFYTDIGRYTIERVFEEKMILTNIFKIDKTVMSVFYSRIWNFNIISFFGAIGTTLFLVGSFSFLENTFQKKFHDNIFLPGRFAFANYFYHLAVLAVIVLIFGYNSLNKYFFVILLALLFIGSYFLSMLLKYINKLRKKY